MRIANRQGTGDLIYRGQSLKQKVGTYDVDPTCRKVECLPELNAD